MWLGGWGDEDSSIVANMNIATLPVWPNYPDAGPYLQGYPIMISSLTEHPDAAFQVLAGYVSEKTKSK